MTAAELISWLPNPGDFAGEIGATLSLGSTQWEELGAEFSAVDDGQGETPGLATGVARTSIGEVQFGLLDYDGDSTYLLVPSIEKKRTLTIAVLERLEHAGMISLERDVLDDMTGFEGEDLLEARVEKLESFVADALTAAASPEPLPVPVATITEIGEAAEIEVGGVQIPIVVHTTRPDVERMVTGIVKHYRDDGYGFIKPDDGSEELFVHFKYELADLDLEDPRRAFPDTLELADGTRVSVKLEAPTE